MSNPVGASSDLQCQGCSINYTEESSTTRDKFVDRYTEDYAGSSKAEKKSILNHSVSKNNDEYSPARKKAKLNDNVEYIEHDKEIIEKIHKTLKNPKVGKK